MSIPTGMYAFRRRQAEMQPSGPGPAGPDSSFHLDLDGGSMGIGCAGKDHEVATRDLVLAAHQLADRSDRIDDGCARGVGHEALQWFHNARARRLTRKRK